MWLNVPEQRRQCVQSEAMGYVTVCYVISRDWGECSGRRIDGVTT